MSEFTSPIQLIFVNPAKPTVFTVAEGWRYYLDWESAAEYVQVTTDLESDGVSTPTRFRGLLPKIDQRSLKAGITHDLLYKHPVIYFTDVQGMTRPCSKSEADKLFYKMLKLGGQGWIGATRNKHIKLYRKHSWNARCMVAYMALVLGGFVAWYMHRFNDWRSKK
jgi:hypothetical protein